MREYPFPPKATNFGFDASSSDSLSSSSDSCFFCKGEKKGKEKKGKEKKRKEKKRKEKKRKEKKRKEKKKKRKRKEKEKKKKKKKNRKVERNKRTVKRKREEKLAIILTVCCCVCGLREMAREAREWRGQGGGEEKEGAARE